MSEPFVECCDLCDFVPDEEAPFSVFQGPCFACGKPCWRTERCYTSDFSFSEHGFFFYHCSYNFGQTVPATDCCQGTLCTSCTMKSEVHCKICAEPTSAMFLRKNPPDRSFSCFTNSLTVCHYFQKLEEFERIKERVGEKCQQFFLWLKFRRENGCPDLYWWHNLCLDKKSTQELITEFESSQLASELHSPEQNETNA